MFAKELRFFMLVSAMSLKFRQSAIFCAAKIAKIWSLMDQGYEAACVLAGINE